MSRPNQPAGNDHQGVHSAVISTDYEERIRVLQKSLADVQKLENLRCRTGRNLLAHAELIFDVLDGIKDLHSYIGIATLPFRATLKIVLVKEDNDKRVAALMVEMIDMMSPLIELRNIKELDHKTTTGESTKSNLVRVLETIKDDVEEAGNLVECYSKARSWHRVLRVREWAANFKDMAERFQKEKINIQVALGVHTALSTEAKLDHVLNFMQGLFANPLSPEEQNILAHVKNDDREACLKSETTFIALYKETGHHESGREPASSTSRDKQTNDSRERTRKAKEEWAEIKKPLEDFLCENRSIFETLLEVQKKDIATMVRRSEANIIRAINEGPYSHIDHQDIRNLWKTMQWRLSVKTRHFVMALHDHYLHSARSASYNGTSYRTGDTGRSSLGNDFQSEPFDPADKWCLRYLRIRYLPAISEAFDDDGSGFIKISEVNDFTGGMPEGWNLPRWIAYWTAGWPRELARYCQLIQATLMKLAEAQCKVKPENVECVNDYMTGLALSEIKLLVTSVQSRVAIGSGGSELSRLAAQMKLQTETNLKINLENFKYTIDDSDTLPILCGPGRIDKYLFPLLHILLRKHLEIVCFASKESLDIREMYKAEDSLCRVLKKVRKRVAELRESFQQQKLNVSEQFKTFACGMYSCYQKSDVNKWIGVIPQPPKSDSEDLYEYDTDSESEPEESSSPGTLLPGDIISPIQEIITPIGDNGGAGIVGSDTLKNYRDPTRFGPFKLETSLETQPSNFTEDTAPWRPLRVQYSEIGPREMFIMAAKRVLERVQLLSPPKLTPEYLKRRRSIRLRWIEIANRPDYQYVSPGEHKEWERSNEEEREDLMAQVTPRDVSYYDSLTQWQARLCPVHEDICDGCKSPIVGKKFECLECYVYFDLCNDCEHAEVPRHDVVSHPSSHTMLQYNYPIHWSLLTAFENRARKYMIKHSKQPCPCTSAASTVLTGGATISLQCHECQKEIKNEVHFRCLQCPDYDLCKSCEENHSRQLDHCQAHVLLKLQAPFFQVEAESSDDTDDDEPLLSMKSQLVRLKQRLTNLETKFGRRLDELQNGFMGLDELQKNFKRAITLLEDVGAQEKRRMYLNGSTRSHSLFLK